jgi:SAM-dependent methyltransferase
LNVDWLFSVCVMVSNIESERQRWDVRAEVYENPQSGVFSLTKYPFVIAQILKHIKVGRVLDFGCGPTGRMLSALESCGCVAEGVDLSPVMIEKTRQSGFQGRLLCDDTRLLKEIEDSRYTSVVSLNSILPPEQGDALAMFRQCYRVLDFGGVFIAIVISYDYHLRASEAFPDIVIDHKRMRVWEEEGWQCMFSGAFLHSTLHEIGFSYVDVQPLVFSQREVFRDVEQLYGLRLPEHLPLEELFVVAKK